MGAAAFDKVLGIIPNGKKLADIEKLLTQCKLYVALYGDTDANGKLVAEFIAKAKVAILARTPATRSGKPNKTRRSLRNLRAPRFQADGN
ncbi:hypothetical protein [Bradyrhizobium sp. CCBAU 51627]|uniref:hypothetical protein n=1 Tax=Bradyrhizobium sp. CCBAU 51627 TaxID=1325088 RepID=UPI002305B341|nr:hypothetical protein [Bradyrhizobium sp. CCBAU 51627]MDA9433707.1 hypothetical protein [Bradyrhizobium sp. CCBAU 51627]